MRIIDIALHLPPFPSIGRGGNPVLLNSEKFSPMDVEVEWNGCGNTQKCSLGNNGLIDAQLLYTINPHLGPNH